MPRGKKKAAASSVPTTAAESTAAIQPVANEPPTEAVAPAAETPTEKPASDTVQPLSIAHNNVAGLRLLKYSRYKQVQLQFKREVPDDIRQRLEADHWRFRPEEGVFTRQFGLEGEAAAIISARRLFGELCQQLGGGRGTGVPF